MVARWESCSREMEMLDIAIGLLLLLSFILMVILSYINYKILNITIHMLEVTIEVRDVSVELLEVTKQLKEGFSVKEKDVDV
jgi:hypothetical protein